MKRAFETESQSQSATAKRIASDTDEAPSTSEDTRRRWAKGVLDPDDENKSEATARPSGNDPDDENKSEATARSSGDQGFAELLALASVRGSVENRASLSGPFREKVDPATTVVDLRNELRAKGWCTNGCKSSLCERVQTLRWMNRKRDVRGAD